MISAYHMLHRYRHRCYNVTYISGILIRPLRVTAELTKIVHLGRTLA